jgi:hypothetical protein
MSPVNLSDNCRSVLWPRTSSNIHYYQLFCLLLHCIWRESGRSEVFFYIQTGSRAHPASYPMDTGGSFPGGKAVEAWS